MSKYKLVLTPQQDAETLVVGLNSLFTSKSRTKMFSLAREMTRRNITDDELMRDMLEAMELLERTFPPTQ